MNRSPICSNKHFSRLIKNFKRIATAQLKQNPKLKSKQDLVWLLANDCMVVTPLDTMLQKLEFTYKRSPFKSHSKFSESIIFYESNRFDVSYTIENDSKNRLIGKQDYINANIVFKIHMVLGSSKKVCVARWSVKVDWV